MRLKDLFMSKNELLDNEEKQPNLQKFVFASKNGFPVIDIQTFEFSRAEEICNYVAKITGKTVLKIPPKTLPDRKTIESIIKNTDNNRGYIIIDTSFFEKEKLSHQAISSLRDNLNFFEDKGINYVIIAKNPLNEEFVYHLELDDMSEKQILDLLNRVVENLKKGALFDEKEKKLIANYARGLSHMQMKNLFTMISSFKYKKIDYLPELKKEKEHLLKDYGLIVEEPISFDNLGGLDVLKDYIKIRKAGWERNIEQKGLVFRGVPGTGKSASSKAIANEFETMLVKIDFSVFFSKFVGETEEKLRRALKIIEQIAPITVLIDEMDKTFSNKNNDSDLNDRLKATFLNWLQERKGKIYLIATANNEMPVELTRAGRFDKNFFFDIPNVSERDAIIKVYMKKHEVKLSTLELDEFKKLTHSYVGGEIKQIFNDALNVAIYEDKKVDFEILEKCIKQIAPISKTKKEDIEEIRKLKDNGYVSVSSQSYEDDYTNVESKRKVLD